MARPMVANPLARAKAAASWWRACHSRQAPNAQQSPVAASAPMMTA